jgi:NAD+ kinase
LQPLFPDIPAYIDIKPEEDLLNSSDIILSFGGDGTILRSARLVGWREKPILGVNLGGLGFLTTSSTETVKADVEAFFKKQRIVEKRSVFEVKINGEEGSHYLLNDLVLDKAGFSRLIKITANLDGRLLNSYLADGILISTPTGSTGYSLANGGPVVAPATNAFIINPICPHTLSNRPIVVPDNVLLSLTVESEHRKFNLFGDGEIIGTFPEPTTVTLQKAAHAVHLVQTHEQNFYKILREKLGWGEDIRNKIKQRNNL